MQNYLYWMMAILLLGYMSAAFAKQETDTNMLLPRGISFVPRENSVIERERIALVIGNGRYRHINSLKNPRNDALAMKRVLSQLGFDVVFIANATLAQMQQSVSLFGEKLQQSKAVGLFYYAGHGVQVEGSNYLLPVDLNFQQQMNLPQLKSQSLALNQVLLQMDKIKEQLKLVILDACRENPFYGNTRNLSWSGLERGLAKIEAPSGTYIAYATAPGELAADGGNGRHGLYTKHLLENITKANLVVEQMFKLVRLGVMRDTNNQQVPWDSSSLVGDFYFVPSEAKFKLSNSLKPIENNDECAVTRGADRPINCFLGSNQ